MAGILPMRQTQNNQYINHIWYAPYVQGQQSCGPNTNPCQKPYKFDLDVKGQHSSGIMNVRDTASHGGSPMCQI